MKKIRKILFLALLLSGQIYSLAADVGVQQSATLGAPQFYYSEPSLQLRHALEDALSNAKKSILIFMFAFADLSFIQLLNEKAEEGVDVTIVINKDHRGPLLQNGSDKLKILTRTEGEGRIHHKIIVIDDEDVWIGSANFSSSAFFSQENVMVRVESKPLAEALRYEAEVFQGKAKRVVGVPPSDLAGNQEITLYLLPHFDPHCNSPEKQINAQGKQELLSLIQNAKKQIRIAMMLLTDRDLEQALLAAHRRGVSVELLVADANAFPLTLRMAGISVIVNPHATFMHNKWMLVDDTIFVNGSANWTASSFSRNDESFVVIKNLDANQQSFFEQYWKKLVTPGL